MMEGCQADFVVPAMGTTAHGNMIIVCSVLPDKQFRKDLFF
jgi:hypothetical protein